MTAVRVDPEKAEQEIRAMFYRHVEQRSCIHGLHGYMASDGAPCYLGFPKPPKPETELTME